MKKTLKHHFLQQLLHHPEGADAEALVQKTAASAGVRPDTYRQNILDWINYLSATGHVKREGDTVTPRDVSRLEAIHEIMEADRDRNAVERDPQLLQFFRSERP